MLDVECSIRGSSESYIAKVKAQHRHNPRLIESKPIEPRTFGIQHFAGRVTYDATDFLGNISKPSYIFLLHAIIIMFVESNYNLESLGGYLAFS